MFKHKFLLFGFAFIFSFFLIFSFSFNYHIAFASSYNYSLPDEYQQVEYIGSDGTQYINSGLYSGDGYLLSTNMCLTAGGNKSLAGVQLRNGAERAFGPWCNTYVNGFFNLGLGVGGAVSSDNLFTLNTYYNVDCNVSVDNPYLSVDGFNLTFTNSPGGALSSNIANDLIYIFAINNSGNPASYFYGNITFMKIYINDILVRDFVPCYRISDDVTGLYDLVTNTFFTNDGTGSFLRGSEVYPEHSPYSNLIDNFLFYFIGGLSSFFSMIGGVITDNFTTLFLINVSGTTYLSVFGNLIFIFLGLCLTLAIVRFIIKFCLRR